MTVSTNATPLLLQHPAFAGLTEAGRQRLERSVRYVRYDIGKPLSTADLLSDRILLILEGQARLLLEWQGRMVTVGKLGPGDLVGLASLLRAAPCEQVHASEPLLAASLPDKLVLDLLSSEAGFRHWCQTTLFKAELAGHLGRSPSTLPAEALRWLEGQSQILLPEPKAVAELPTSLDVVVASANVSDHRLGAVLERSASLPSPSGPLPLRLLALPPAGSGELTSPAVDGDHAESQTSASSSAMPLSRPGQAGLNISTDKADTRLRRSSLDLGQPDAASTLKLVRGHGALAETQACFQMLGSLMGLPYRRDALDKVLQDHLERGQKPTLQLCGQLAANLGLHVVGTTVPSRHLARLQIPALVVWGDGFGLITASNSSGITVASPADGWVQLDPQQVLERFPEGIPLLTLERGRNTKESRFNLNWFWPAIQRHRTALIQVMVASFVVQIFTLANPLLIQVIIDKVISQRSLDTLQVLGFGLLGAAVLEGVLGGLRTFLFRETTNRIDLRLGAEVIDHLLRLPLSYFDQRPVGELSSRVSELEKIRNFLTGQALNSLIDAVFAVIYIIVMVIYSWLLTLVALAVVPIQIGITLLGAPLFRRQMRRTAEANARTQSHLVEVLSGIQTVKAQNVEMVSRWKWQDLYANYVDRSFEQTITGTTLSQTSQILQKVSQLLVLWIGATLVLQGNLTLGQLIAFRIISSYVTQPLLRLSTIWQSIQELQVSFERLADVVDTPQESNEIDQTKLPLPAIEGEVRFENVTFRFAPNSAPVLRDVSLSIPAGTFVGVVGQSGSGKSTLMKLLSRLYSPEQGRIMIDDTDISKVELYSLRRQIGIVPQEPLLFSGSVSDNIAIANPNATFDEIVAAAKAACAHEFVMQLPDGYSTNVGERGSSLSGGQRQRLAIARTLLTRPRLLILDEATSALDYDTERQVCLSLRDRLEQCTVFFITHRLSTIRNADRILLMDRGTIAESGNHDQLISLRGRYYALSRQQEVVA